MTTTGWTLDELTARVAAALDGAAYAGAPNGRVRDVPDARAIRWYATIGLVDRPTMRGRIALYGPRHLLQLVAIKRRQSQGMRIADIQAELADAPDDVLRSIAAVPAAAMPAAEVPALPAPVPAEPRQRFWTEPPGEHQLAPAPETDAQAEELLAGVPLDGGAVLLLPGPPSADDVHAIRAAARPLLDLLTARGLLPNKPNTGSAK